MDNIPEVAVIVPAHNEADHIDSVLDVLSRVDRINEILVVDDGSCDSTANRVQIAADLDKRVRLIRHSSNLGKGQAIFTARKATKAPILLLLDADLAGLEPMQVLSLIEPVVSQRVDMTLGLFRGGKLLTDFSHLATPWLTGQRCMWSSILDELDVGAASGYGFETALTLAAARKNWRTGIVWLRGVWHPPSEFHHGLMQGISQRIRMYLQIARAWHMAGGRFISWRKTPKRILPFFLALFLLGFIVFARDNIVAYSAAGRAGEFDNLPVFAIDNFHRILIIAPHPDDESLAAGGLIQKALAEDSQVKVVIVTNGDAQEFAPVILSRKIDPGPQDFVAMGNRREAESVAALEKLGLRSDDIEFLGYPDRGIGPMWLADWNTQCPYTSSYTRVKKDPYPDTYHRGGAYCGRDLLKDLQTTIEGYRPDLIILPHPADQNPDHEAVSNFARLAIAMTTAGNESDTTEVWGYLVHYGMFPQPRGEHLSQVLVPPGRLMGSNTDWGRVDLTPSQVSLKYSAIEDYSSQDLLLGQFLPSFARRNELFEALPIQILRPITFTTLPIFIHGADKNPFSDLSGVYDEEFPVKGNLLTGWQAAHLNDKMWLDLHMKRDMLPDLDCTLYLKLPDGRTEKLALDPIGSVFASRDFVAQVDLATLGNPSVIAFATEIRQGGFLVSKNGWHILVLE
jgi:LmbE family N-acetylglucosaminyl deacetylase/glycosyltransferase involved in cell wall biosynthesis